jgi:hypothetical protein
MKALSLATAIAVFFFVAGCTAFGPDGSPATQELQELCYWLDNSEIQSMLNDITDARDEGVPEEDLEEEAATECGNSSLTDDCNECFTLAIDSVYH